MIGDIPPVKPIPTTKVATVPLMKPITALPRPISAGLGGLARVFSK